MRLDGGIFTWSWSTGIIARLSGSTGCETPTRVVLPTSSPFQVAGAARLFALDKQATSHRLEAKGDQAEDRDQVAEKEVSHTFRQRIARLPDSQQRPDEGVPAIGQASRLDEGDDANGAAFCEGRGQTLLGGFRWPSSGCPI